MDRDMLLRQQLVDLLTDGHAHMTFEAAVKDFPEAHINTRIPHADYTFWHIVEHIRFCQWDILDYIRNPDFQTFTWPDDYWPAREATTDKAGWDNSVQQVIDDLAALVGIIQNPENDLFAQIPHGRPGHTILREVHSTAIHNSYHIGELGSLRQAMDLW